MNLTLCCPTLFGLEGLVADELRFAGKLTDVHAENGRVFFSGDEHTLAWANLNLRCAERVLIQMGTFPAKTFDQLFEGVRALPWENFIPEDAAFPVKGHSLDSALHSIPDCQKIIKKAIVNRLSQKYGISWFEETGARYQIQFAIMNDRAEIYLDTSGVGLHKRGYRPIANAAPLRETLASAMVKLARWRGRDEFIDPFCGSGTIAIEAAQIAMRRAPGMMRTFDAEKWDWIDASVWKDVRESAIANINPDDFAPIFGSDIDPACLDISIENARRAGVLSAIRFSTADATTLHYADRTGVLMANPPYGERLLDLHSAQRLYTQFGQAVGSSALRQYILSSDADFEQCYGRKADKRRKLYNGMIKCDLYMYFRDPAFAKKHTGSHSANHTKQR